jgi:hypothetical protein
MNLRTTKNHVYRTALHFTNHTISGGGTSRFLKAFDEEYDDDGAKGGNLKRGFLTICEIPHIGKFDRLDELIKELTQTLALLRGAVIE